MSIKVREVIHLSKKLSSFFTVRHVMGWKMTGDRDAFDSPVRNAGFMPEPVALCGAVLPPNTNPFQAPTVSRNHASLTRHHIIPHHLLIETWNHAVDNEDVEVIKSLAIWAGCDPTTELPAVFTATDPTPAPDPQLVLMRVAWNPFNIVVGPKMEHRIGDPGSSFDKMVFRDLGAFKTSDGAVDVNEQWKENLARQDFNRHVERLQRIYNYMVRYTAPEAGMFHPQEVHSLCALLKSDKATSYGNLADGKRALVRFGGSILSPDLWTNFSFQTVKTHGIAADKKEMRAFDKIISETNANTRMPEHAKKSRIERAPLSVGGLITKETKILNNTVQWAVVSWSSKSYLPEVDLPELKPSNDRDVWEPGTATLPYDRLLLSKATFSTQSAAEFRNAIIKAARKTGKFKARVMIVGPRGSRGETDANHDNVVKWTVEAIASLKPDGYNFKIARTFHAAPALEVRFYDFLRG